MTEVRKEQDTRKSKRAVTKEILLAVASPRLCPAACLCGVSVVAYQTTLKNME
jgi:hypothetical protein